MELRVPGFMIRDLTVGTPSKVLLRFCLPLFLSVIFQQLYNLTDSVVAGRFIGEDALAAVGNSYEITLIFIAFAFGCNIGCSVVVANLFGAKAYRELKTAVRTTFAATAATCVLLMTLGYLLSNPLLRLIHTPENIFSDSAVYLDIYILGLPLVFFYNLSTGLFAALGDSKTPFIFLAASSLSNILMDILFVARFGMGVAGVAWATLICQGVSCVLSLIVVLKRMKSIRTEEPVPRFSKKLLVDFAKIAVPSVLQQSSISLGNIYIQSIINSFGSTAIAGYSAAIKLNNMVVSGFTTVGNGVSSYSAQNHGAAAFERIRKGHRAALRLVIFIALPLTCFYFFGGHVLLRLFLEKDAEAAARVGLRFLRIVSPFFIIVAAKLATDGVLRGLGLMKAFMVSTFTDLLLRVILAKVFSGIWGTTGIWCAWPVGWAMAAVMSLYFCLTGIRRLEQENGLSNPRLR